MQFIKYLLILRVILNKFIVLTIIFIVGIPYIGLSKQTTDTIIVKFKQLGSVSDFESKINNLGYQYNLNKLINPNLLPTNDLLKNRNLTQSSKVKIATLSNSLSRTFKLIIYSKIPTDKLLQSLSKLPEVELAELYPQRNTCWYPNDTLFYEQFYMDLLKVPEAWDSLKVRRQILVGVVDTGVDYEHPDLADNIWINPGEDGSDAEGQDKRTNGIDDDQNGFIDDWHGWDFMSSSDSSGYDNDPMPGHSHGTHVSGTIAAIINNITGIAGMCDSIKILPVKIGEDNPFATSLRNSYEGLLYAAKMGAEVINCSWGGTSSSVTEQEVIDLATELGSCVIAAAGNNNSDIGFYPASYNNVLSVAASDAEDHKAYFSNYFGTVDIIAPGIDIISSVAGGGYAKWRGTSMATPIVVGVAAMVKMKYPDYSPIQLHEHLKATTDNIDSLNPQFIGKIGKGRVNALKAVTIENPKNILVKKTIIEDKNGDGRFVSNEECNLSIFLGNYLSKIDNLIIRVQTVDYPENIVLPRELKYGEFLPNTTIELDKKFSFTLPQFDKFDFRYVIKILLYDGAELINTYLTSVFVNPSYLNFSNNKIATTFNSRGNIAFNDYSFNEQGIGFLYDNSPNILFEGSLMIAKDTMIADVARGEGQLSQNKGFAINRNLEYLPLANPNMLAGNTLFNKNIENFPDISVNHWIYQPALPDNVVYSVYDIINNTDEIIDSVYVGLYFDWDIGISGVDNVAEWNEKNQIGIVRNIMIDSLPVIGVKQLTNFQNNFWAIDNDGTTDENPGVWDGFYKEEKIRMLRSGIGRAKSTSTDVSIVSGAGPLFFDRKDTLRVTFALLANKNVDELLKSIPIINKFATDQNIIDGNINKPIEQSKILTVYSNPIKIGDEFYIKLQLADDSNIQIYLYDVLGNRSQNLIEGRYNKSKYLFKIKLPNFAQGSYFIVLEANNTISSVPIIIDK